MKLAAYLQAENETLGSFARRINAKNARTVQRYTKHGQVPGGVMMARIVEATDGKVQPRDFVEAE